MAKFALWGYGFLLWISCLYLSACERPDIPEVRPKFQFTAPDTQRVYQQSSVTVRYRILHYRPIKSVQLFHQEVQCADPVTGCELTVNLQRGLNRFAFAAFDSTGLVGRDTLDLLRLGIVNLTSAPSLPEARGGMAVTKLHNNEWLLTGGCAGYQQNATTDAFLYRQGAFVRLSSGLKVARTGHTQSLLPDGRVLITGGSKKEMPETITDLVELAEVYSPQTQQFEVVKVVATDPIRQTYHSAFILPYNGSVYLYQFGGKGDIRYGATPTIGTKEDLRAFKWENDSLKVASPTFGALIRPMMGHSQIQLQQDGQKTVYWINGGNYATNQVVQRGYYFVIQNQQFDEQEAPTGFTPRFRAVAVYQAPDYVWMHGGSSNGFLSGVNASAELFLPLSKKWLKMGDIGSRRMAHVALQLDATRTLICGGYTEGGAAKNSCESIVFN